MILWRDIIKRKRRIIDIRKKGEEKMKKRFFALLTAVCIALTTGLTTGLTALADGGENSDMTIGMSTQEQCSCTTLCTEGNINPDCPVCSAEGAELDKVCVGAAPMLPVTALAVAPIGQVLYVGGVQISSTGYWTTDSEGKVTSAGATQPSNNYIHYDAGNNTLTLHNATIKEEVPYNTSTYVAGAAIGVHNQNGAAELTITLEGTNTIAEVGKGIYVLANSTGGATLTITGDGSLDASASQTGIWVQSNNGNGALFIQNAKVEATGTNTAGYGVNVQSSNSSTAALTVDGGSLTASGSPGILYDSIGSGTVPKTTALTISNSAIVDARNGEIGAGSTTNLQPVPPSGNGIVFNGDDGTVYGVVTLKEDLEIGEGESLTLDDGANLSAGDHNVIVDGGTLDENLANSLGDSVKYAPTITTTTLPNGTVGTAYNQTLIADGTAPIKWSVTDGSLPDGLNLNKDTGEIFGTPTTETTSTFTVTATNDVGSDSKEFTLTIGVAPVYSITAEPLKLDFGTLTEGYTPASQTVTITNNGNQPLTLNEPVSTEHFEVGNLSKTELVVGEEVTFTVQPKAGLAAGTYSEDIDVTASNNATATISASLTVQKASVPTKPEVPSTGTTSGGSTGESTYPDVEDAQTSYEQATRDFWNRTINKIKKADEGDSLRIYIGIHKEIPGDVIQAIRENGVNVTFYNQDGDEVTVYAESAPTKYQAVWTLKQLGNYVLTEQQTPAAQEESPADQQPADEPTTPTQPAETEAVDTAKPNPSTGEGSGAVIAVIAAAAALAGLGATLRKR